MFDEFEGFEMFEEFEEFEMFEMFEMFEEFEIGKNHYSLLTVIASEAKQHYSLFTLLSESIHKIPHQPENIIVFRKREFTALIIRIMIFGKFLAE